MKYSEAKAKDSVLNSIYMRCITANVRGDDCLAIKKILYEGCDGRYVQEMTEEDVKFHQEHYAAEGEKQNTDKKEGFYELSLRLHKHCRGGDMEFMLRSFPSADLHRWFELGNEISR